MSVAKTFKIRIDKVSVSPQHNSDITSLTLSIKLSPIKPQKTFPLSEVLGFVGSISQSQTSKIQFFLKESNILGAREPRILGYGCVQIDTFQIQKQGTCERKCQILNIVNEKKLVILKITLEQDYERVNFNLDQLGNSEILEQSRQSSSENQEDKHLKQSNLGKDMVLEELNQEIGKKRTSPYKWNIKKNVRNRRFQYSVKNELANLEIINKVNTDEHSHSIENFRIDFDEAISDLEFRNETGTVLAQVLCKTNPSAEQIKALSIKIPAFQKKMQVVLKTIEGVKLYSIVNLPQLDQNECLKIQCQLLQNVNKNQTNNLNGSSIRNSYQSLGKVYQKKASMKFNYKDASNLGNNQKQTKMQMGKQVDISQSQLKMKQRARYLGFLFAESKQKQIESFKLKLPRIDRNNQFSTLVSNDKSNYISNGNPGRRSTISEQQLSSRSRQNFKAQTQADQSDYREVSPLRKRRSKTIHSKPSHLMTKFLHDEKKVFVKIVDVSIKNNFYLFQAVENKYSADKYLVIFSNNQNKYHSQKNQDSQILNWNFSDCEIEMGIYESLKIELREDKQKSLIGNLTISYNQLKFHQEENSVYSGFLTFKHDIMGKINIDFQLKNTKQSSPLLLFNTQSSQAEERQVFPRNFRFYSEEIDTETTEQYPKREQKSSYGYPYTNFNSQLQTVHERSGKNGRKAIKNYSEVQSPTARNRRYFKSLEGEKKVY